MKIIKKIFVFMTIVAFILTITAYLILKTGILTNQFKNYAKSELNKLTGKDIDIERIEIGFINNITIKNIKIPLRKTVGESGEFIDVSSIVFRFNLVDLLIYRKNIDETLSHIIINSPVFHLKREKGEFNIKEFIESFIIPKSEGDNSKTQFVIPVNRIFIEKGKVIYEDLDKNFLTSLDFRGNITYRHKPNSVRLFVFGKTAQNQKNNIKLDFNYFISNNFFKSEIQIKDEPLSLWFSYFMPDERIKANDGSFSANLSIEGTELKQDKFRVRGVVSLSRANLLVFQNKIVDLNTDISIIDDKIYSTAINFDLAGGKCNGNGSIKDIFGKLIVDGNFTFNDIDTSLIIKGLMGKLSGGVVFKGDKDSMAISGKFFDDSSNVKSAKIENFDFEILLNKRELHISSLNARIGDGVISGSGIIPFEGVGSKNLLNIKLQKLDFSKILDNKNLKGFMDANLKYTGTFQNPKFVLQLNSDKINFNGNTASGIKSTFALNKKRLTVIGNFDYNDYKNLRLNGNIEFEKDFLKIGSIKLNSGENVLVDIVGIYNLKDRLINMKSNINGLKISYLGIPVIKGKDIDGNINGKIILKGTSVAPELEATFDISKLFIQKKENFFHCRINYKNNAIKFSELFFNDNLIGNGEFSLKNKIFNLNMAIKQLQGYVLKEFTGLDLFNDSIIDGTVFIKKQEDGYGGSVAITSNYSKSDYKSFNINIKGEKNEFVINGINLLQTKGGLLHVSGLCRYTNNEILSFSLNGKVKDFIINDKMKLNCNLKADSSFTIRDGLDKSFSNISFSNILLNKKNIGDSVLSLKTKRNSLPVIFMKIGEEYIVDLKPKNDSGKEISLLCQLKNADLLPLYAALNFRDNGLDEASMISGKITVDGELQNAVVTGNISQKNGNMSISGNIGFIKQGFVYKPSIVNINYNLLNLGIKELLVIFFNNVKESGRINGKGTLKGKIGNLESDGNIILSDGVVAGLPFDSIKTDYNVKNRKIFLKNLFFEYKKTYFNIYDSSIEIKDNNEFYLILKTNLKDYVWRGNKLNGEVNFYGKINNQKDLKIDGSIGSDNFTFKNHKFQPFLLKVYSDKEGLTIKTSKGKSVFEAFVKNLKEKIIIENLSVENERKEKYFSGQGEIQKEKGDSRLLFEAFNMNPQMINDLMGWDYKWTGGLNGSIKVSGNIKQGLAFTMFLTIYNGSVNNLDFDVFTGVISLKDHWVNLSPVSPMLVTKTDKYDIKITGKIPAPMSEEGVEKLKGVPMDVRAVIKNGDLSVIKFINWIDDASGPIDMDLHIGGTKEFPVVNGKLVITDASAKLKYLFNSLNNIFANVFIKDNIIDIYSFRADTQKGTLKISNLTEKNGGTMKWIKPYEANWKVVNIGDKIRITDTKYMEFIEGDADIDLDITGPLSGPTVKGVMKISDLRYRYPVKMKNQKGEISDIKNNYAKQINWDLKVFGGDNVYYYNDDYVNTYAQVYLKIGDNPLLIHGRNEDLKIYGNINLPKGVYKYINTEFSIDPMAGESKAVFDGMTKPILNVYASSKIKRIEIGKNPGRGVELPGIGGRAEISGTMDLNVNMRVWGRVGDIKIDLTSEPALDRNRLLYILTFGKDAGGFIAADDAYKMAEALANAWIKGRTEEIKKFAPLDVIDIKVSDVVPRPEETSEEGVTPTSKTKMELGIGKFLTDQFYLDYRMRLLEGRSLLGDANLNLYLEHSLGFEYSLDPTNKLVLEGIIKDPTFSTYRFEGFMGLESRFSFDAWGAKPKPTPTHTKK